MSKSFLYFIFYMLAYLSSSGQTQSSVNRMVALIETIPQQYSVPYRRLAAATILSKQDDGWFRIIVKYDTAAIPFLINLVSDTTPSKAVNQCSNLNYKISDLAVLLINEIESIPYAVVTRSQWCLPGECGILPYGFMDYTNTHRNDFQAAYKTYYSSNERQEILKAKRHNQQSYTRKR